jgi:TOBE domain-containing protein
VRVELVVEGSETVAAELSRDEADRLPLEPGEPVYVRPRRERRFAEAETEVASA